MAHPRLIVVSGASGSGKTTLVAFIERAMYPTRLRRLRSVTTRSERPSDDRAYRYITREFFGQLITSGMFLWTKEIHGHLYGTSRKDLREALQTPDSTVAVLTPDCIPKIRNAAGEMGCREEEMLFVHIMSPGEDELRNRLTARGDNPEAIRGRIKDCRGWDEYVRNLPLPVRFITNGGELGDLQCEVSAILKGQ